MKFVPITELLAGFAVKRRLNRDFIKFIDEVTSETSPCKSELTIVGSAEVLRVCENAQYFEKACHEDVQQINIANETIERFIEQLSEAGFR